MNRATLEPDRASEARATIGGQTHRRHRGRKLLLFSMTSVAAVAFVWALSSNRAGADGGSRRRRRNRRGRR